MDQSTRIKVCGVTSAADARMLAAEGVDAIGLVFHAASPRNISIEQAREVIAALPVFVSVVALTMNATAEMLQQICEELRPDLLQFHGDEPNEFCQRFELAYIKAFSAQSILNDPALLAQYSGARAILVDGHLPGEQGGSGQVFDWKQLGNNHGHRLVLAGGLKPENVEEAIITIRPGAVDASSGVESAPGIKDQARVRAFIENVRRADAHISNTR